MTSMQPVLTNSCIASEHINRDSKPSSSSSKGEVCFVGIMHREKHSVNDFPKQLFVQIKVGWLCNLTGGCVALAVTFTTVIVIFRKVNVKKTFCDVYITRHDCRKEELVFVLISRCRSQSKVIARVIIVKMEVETTIQKGIEAMNINMNQESFNIELCQLVPQPRTIRVLNLRTQPSSTICSQNKSTFTCTLDCWKEQPTHN